LILERSRFASVADLEDPALAVWLDPLGIDEVTRRRHNRKVWEWCYVLASLESIGLLEAGRSALGFGVGRERLPAIMASRGMRVVATDQGVETAGDWATTDQHAGALDELRYDDVCPSAVFEQLVSFRPVDMNEVPADLTGFDVVWSSCAFEHLGSPAAGLRFVRDSVQRLAPGGVAVHTTEVRVDGGDDLDLRGTVLYSVGRMRALVGELRALGYETDFDLHVPAAHEHDRFVDEAPYQFAPAHMKMAIGGAVSSSFGLVVRRPS
jgi:Methyltransferase domain